MRQCKQLLVKYVERGMTLPGYGRAGPSLPPRWQDNVFSGKWSVLGWSERKLLHQGAFFCPRIDRALHWNFRSLGLKIFWGLVQGLELLLEEGRGTIWVRQNSD